MKNIIIIFLLIISINSNAQERKAATITVKGVSNLSVQPDEGMLNLSVTHIGLDVNQALIGLDKKSKEIIKKIVAAGLNEQDVKTTNFQLNKHTVYRRGTNKDSGYYASHSLQVKFMYSKDKVAKILNSFSESKADYNMGFNFMLSDTLDKQTTSSLIKLAVKDAKIKANTLALEAGVKLKSIKAIEYGIATESQAYPMMKTRSMMMADDGGGAAMQGFTPNNIEVNDEVLMIWEIE